MEALFRVLPHGAGITELVEMGLSPPAEAVTTAMTSVVILAAAVREPVLALSRLVSGDMAEMFGSGALVPSDTGVVVRFGEGLGESVLAVAVVAIAGWLEAILASGQTHRRIVLVDESWTALKEEAVTSALQRLSKLGRTRGVQLILLAHKVSDFFGQSAVGTAAYQQAKNLLSEPGIRIIYGQDSGELEGAAETFGLAPAETRLVAKAERAHGLWQMGDRSMWVHHCLLAEEVRLVDTGAGL